MTREKTQKNDYIHYCVNCGTRLSSKQASFTCPNCGSTTFKLKKMKKEVKISVKETTTQKKSDTQKPDERLLVFEDTAWVEKPEKKRLETIKLDGLGRFEIDVNGLMRGKPLILSVEEGLYEISIQRLMERIKKR
ncbi:MAG: OapC/ArvC family zinc-ribbon domain-containing protein [Candidatus Freyarchaeota archaeon]